MRLAYFFVVIVLLAGCGKQSSSLIPATVGGSLSTVAATSAKPAPTTLPTATGVPTPTLPPTATPGPTPDATATANHAAMPTHATASATVAGSPTASAPPTMMAEVRIVNFAFDPPVVVVPVGTTVVWLNVEGYHTVLSADFRLESPILEKAGDSYSYTFTEEGIYDYICGVHPDMLGVVQVVP